MDHLTQVGAWIPVPRVSPHEVRSGWRNPVGPGPTAIIRPMRGHAGFVCAGLLVLGALASLLSAVPRLTAWPDPPADSVFEMARRAARAVAEEVPAGAPLVMIAHNRNRTWTSTDSAFFLALRYACYPRPLALRVTNLAAEQDTLTLSPGAYAVLFAKGRVPPLPRRLRTLRVGDRFALVRGDGP
jgi:hypothetical protein